MEQLALLLIANTNRNCFYFIKKIHTISTGMNLAIVSSVILRNISYRFRSDLDDK